MASVPISITICGDSGCGKSSITLRLVRSQWTSDYDPTIEDSYSVSRRIDGTTYHLALTDTAGQEEYRGMWAAANLGADAFLLVYDITSRASLDALQYFADLVDMEAETRLDNARRARREHHQLEQQHQHQQRHQQHQHQHQNQSQSSSATTPLSRIVPPVKIVAGNKCDLQQSREVFAAVGLDWARRRGCGFMETSARLEVNIEETFALIVRRVVENRRLAAAALAASAAGPAPALMTRPHALSWNDEAGGVGGSASSSLEKRQPSALGRSRLRAGVDAAGQGHRGGLWRKLRCW